MPGDIFLDRSPGMPGDASAERFNALNEVARTVLRRQGKSGLNASGSIPDYAIINTKNQTGEQVPVGGVLGLGGFNITPADNLSSFKEGPSVIGVLPTEADHAGKFAIALEPIGVGKIAKAAVGGAVICKIDMQAEGDLFADVYDEDVTKLKSGASGLARIISVESGTGEKWALIAFRGGGGGDCDCPEHWYQIRFQIVNTSGTPTYNLVMVVNGTPYGVNTIAIASSAATIKTAIETVFTANPTPFAGFEVYTNGGDLPGTSVGVRFVVPDGVTFKFSRGTQSATTFLVRVDPMTAPEIP